MNSQEHKVFDLVTQDPRVMWEIVRLMKIIPELPSEQPNDVQPLTRVEFLEKGGVVTYMGSMPFPYKGFPFFEFVDKIDVLKKLFRGFLSGCYHQFKRKKLLLITLLPAFWAVKPLSRVALYTAHRHIDRFKIKPEMYSDAVRALYYAFTREDMSEFQVMFRDTLCMVLEMDNAYRYRFQDVIVNLDKYALNTDPKRELLRLLGILSERERTQDVKDTWTLIKLATSFYLSVDREFKNNLVSGFTALELSQVKMTIEDKLFAAGRKDYLFGFMLSPDKETKYCIEFTKINTDWVNKVQDIRDESTKVHQETFTRQNLEQKLIARKMPDEDLKRIDAEIAEKAQGLLKNRDTLIQNVLDNHRQAEKDMIFAYLTPEQKKLAEIHSEETKKLDEEWTKKLTDGEDNYKIQCQQLNSILNKDSHLPLKPLPLMPSGQ